MDNYKEFDWADEGSLAEWALYVNNPEVLAKGEVRVSIGHEIICLMSRECAERFRDALNMAIRKVWGDRG